MLISVDNALPTSPNLIAKVWERSGVFSTRTGSSETRLAILGAGEPRALMRRGHPARPGKPGAPSSAPADADAAPRTRPPQQPAAGLARTAGAHSLVSGQWKCGDTDQSRGLQAGVRDRRLDRVSPRRALGLAGHGRDSEPQPISAALVFLKGPACLTEEAWCFLSRLALGRGRLKRQIQNPATQILRGGRRSIMEISLKVLSEVCQLPTRSLSNPCFLAELKPP